jgi:protein ImuB
VDPALGDLSASVRRDHEVNVVGVIFAADGSDPAALVDVAREFSPRVEVCGSPQRTAERGGCREVVLDVRGLSRLFGDARTIAEELRRTAADRGLRVRVAIAGTRTAARLLVRHRAGLTIVEPGAEAAAVASLPIALLAAVAPERNDSNDSNVLRFRQWGLRRLGEIAALPAEEMAARLGQAGIAWQRLARGEDLAPLVPAAPEERFEQALDLEWPIDGLEPLSFVLGRLLEPLSAHLERRDRGAAVLHVRLHLVTRHDGVRQVHERSLQLPIPIRDARTLRTLALLDLESHPPAAAVDRVVVAVDPTPGRIVQFSILTRPLPSPERISTLMARLDALMGEGRCGAPAPVDTWRPGAFAMQPFAPSESRGIHPSYDTPRHEDTEVLLPRCLGAP